MCKTQKPCISRTFHANEDEIFLANRLKRVRAMITLKTTTATDVPMPKAYLEIFRFELAENDRFEKQLEF